jgi:hypothetical protein
LAIASAITACADSTTAIVQSLRNTIQSDTSVSGAKLNPALRYLRATVRDKAALLVLGYVEADPQGPIQVWYSAEREVVRLQNGRIVGAVGMLTEWRNVKLSNVPSWYAISNGTAARVLRVRDVMPGYRYGVTDVLAVRATTPPPRSALQGVDPNALAWFEESIEIPRNGLPREESSLPVSRYAISFADGKEEVVYGEQCLSNALCFTWQRWPPAQANAAK